MSFSSVAFAASTLALLSTVSAHGIVSGIVADGKFNTGYSPSFQYSNPPPTVAAWSIPGDLNLGFVAPANFQDPDIICHVGATNAGTSITVAAGSTVELQWTTWPGSHKGPVIDYLASCNGECETVDKTALKFFKIDEKGLIDGANSPGKWASDELIANNNSWTATIPADIAPGNYVLRHEILALHSAYGANGAQNYPQCINVIVTGSGTAQPAGVVGTALYKSTDAGILVNIYQTLASYTIPGPALYKSGAAPAPVVSSSATVAPTAKISSPPFPFINSTAAGFPTLTGTAPIVQTSSAGALVVSRPTSDAPGVPTNSAAPVVPGPAGGAPGVPYATSAPVVVDPSVPAGPQPTTPSVCDAAATVTVAAATLTVTARATTVNVTASAKPLPSGATLDNIISWFASGIKNAAGSRSRRHARAVKL